MVPGPLVKKLRQVFRIGLVTEPQRMLGISAIDYFPLECELNFGGHLWSSVKNNSGVTEKT